MKSKGKQLKFQTDWWNAKDGECTYGNFWKWFKLKKTTRFKKHKKQDLDF